MTMPRSPGRPRTTPDCRRHVGKRATWPVGQPQFCTKSCAAESAVNPTAGYCFTHEEWDDDGDECRECRHEQHAAYRACHGPPPVEDEADYGYHTDGGSSRVIDL